MLDRRGVAFCVAVFLAARLGLSLLGWLGIQSETSPPIARPAEAGRRAGAVDVMEVPGPGRVDPATPGLHNIVDGTSRWDASWYLTIVREGYVAEPVAAFFPGYPVAVRVVDELTPMGSLEAALFISSAAFLAALMVLYRLSIREYDEQVARRTVLLITFFPTSFFFLAPYGESLFLLTAVLAFASARAGSWAPAGIAGAIAWATRSIGITLVPALLLEAWMQGVPRTRRLIWAVVPAVGPAAYFAWWWMRAGDPLIPFVAQTDWHREPSFPLVTLGRGVATGMHALGDPLWLPEAGDAVLTLIPLAVLLLLWRRLPSISYGIYAALGFLLPLSLAIPERPLLSMPRFVIVLFPIAWLGALALQRRWQYRGVLLISVTGWIGLSVGFMNWRFIA